MKYSIANWKMNLNLEQIEQWLTEFSQIIKSSEQTQITSATQILLAPSTPYLYKVKEAGFEACAQDISIEQKGAHTGETGTFQISDYCKFCIVGHSERKEDLETVIAKRDLCIQQNITPIVCFTNPEDVVKVYKNDVLVAWEDPTNISHDGVYTEKNPADIENGVKTIRSLVPPEAVLIYGGSVNDKNIKGVASIEGINGVLVGNASLNPQEFFKISMEL